MTYGDVVVFSKAWSKQHLVHSRQLGSAALLCTLYVFSDMHHVLIDINCRYMLLTAIRSSDHLTAFRLCITHGGLEGLSGSIWIPLTSNNWGLWHQKQQHLIFRFPSSKAASKATGELVIYNLIFWRYFELDSENVWKHYSQNQYVYNCI